jgi:hypothetical protein
MLEYRNISGSSNLEEIWAHASSVWRKFAVILRTLCKVRKLIMASVLLGMEILCRHPTNKLGAGLAQSV